MHSLLALTTLALSNMAPLPPEAGTEAVDLSGPLTLRAVIVSYGAEPPGSGVFTFYRDLTVRNLSGEAVSFQILWLGGGQRIPPVGATCDLRYTVPITTDRTDRAELAGSPFVTRYLDSFDCSPEAGLDL